MKNKKTEEQNHKKIHTERTKIIIRIQINWICWTQKEEKNNECETKTKTKLSWMSFNIHRTQTKTKKTEKLKSKCK